MHSLFSPACLWCGARLIQRLGALPRTRQEIATRRRAVLTDWMAYGHSEAELRSLAKGATPLAPASSKPPKKHGA
jgi:hypothetical protein